MTTFTYTYEGSCGHEHICCMYLILNFIRNEHSCGRGYDIANINALFVMLVGRATLFCVLKPVFLPNLIDMLHLQVAQVPIARSPDLAVLCPQQQQ